MLYGSGEVQGGEMLINDNTGMRILDSAIKIINQEGYENLTIRKVAKESGCSNSAIYQRFEDKNVLARAVAALQAKPFLAIMDEMYAKDMSFWINLDRITKKMLEMVYSSDSTGIYVQTVYQGELGLDENPFVMRIEEYLNDAMIRGEIKVSEVRETAFLLFSSFSGFVQMMCVNKDYDIGRAGKLLEIQNHMLYSGICAVKDENFLTEFVETKDRILVVDDKGINRYMLGGIFREDYDVMEASGGQEAIDIITEESDTIAVVLLDIIMPVVDGFGVLENMKGKGLLKRLPVVIVTDDASEETTDRAFEYEVADIVIKPFEPQVIKRRVENIIELYAYRKKERLYGG